MGTIEEISEALFGTWMLPFQATILLLTIAAVGSIALARYEPRGRASYALRSDAEPIAGGVSEDAEPAPSSQGPATSSGGDE